jgi:hypothetical protein
VTTLLLPIVVLVALGGLLLAGRHLLLRLSRPGGFECSLRIANGTQPGLGRRFRAGYAGRELGGFVWRRLAWPSAPVRFPATAVRLDQEHAPSHRDHLLAVPAHFAVVPVEIDDGIRLDLALPRRKLDRVVKLLP